MKPIPSLPDTLAFIRLHREAAAPLHRQIYDAVRQAILRRDLAAGARLPSTRELAASLGISRNTVMTAFDQLLAEGYLESRVGAGTFVTGALPAQALAAVYASPAPARTGGAPRALSRRGQAYRSYWRPADERPDDNAPPPFRAGLPDVAHFPFDTWARLAGRRIRALPASAFNLGRPAGYGPLRAAIAAYLRQTRAVGCVPEQIIVVAGSQQGLYLTAQILLDVGDQAWVEDPGYLGARTAVWSAGARIAPIPVDHEGLDVAAGRAWAPRARVAYVSPSHQYPGGGAMSLARRFRLLHWAAESGAWIVEDDYDSEFRYHGPPLAALQALDNQQRVVYVGSFSKVLFPTLRLGYIVAPPDLAPALLIARSCIDLQPPLLTQAVLADFIKQGHFARHIRRMRRVYRARRDRLVAALKSHLGDVVTIGPHAAGLHLTVWLPPGVDDTAVAAAARGVEVVPLSHLHATPPARGGLVLGYGATRRADIEPAVAQLAAAVAAVATDRAAAPPTRRS